jgi:hypothetical protein
MSAAASTAKPAKNAIPMVIGLLSDGYKYQSVSVYMGTTSTVERVREVYVEWAASMLKSSYEEYLRKMTFAKLHSTRFCHDITVQEGTDYSDWDSEKHISRSYCLYYAAPNWKTLSIGDIWEDAHARGIAKLDEKDDSMTGDLVYDDSASDNSASDSDKDS